MFGDWSPLIWLLATLVLMMLMKHWINLHLQGVMFLLTRDYQIALIVYFVLLLPGVVVHELSHWLMAKLLGVQTGKIHIWPKTKGRSQMRFGSVEVACTDPVRSSLIGLAPLLSGSLIVLLIGEWVLGVSNVAAVILQGDVAAIWDNLLAHVRVPDFWLWLYLIFAVSNAMLPSESDREQWRPVLIFLSLVVVVFYLTGWVPQIPPAIADWLLDGIGYLAYAFGLTVVVDAVFMAFIWAMESAVTMIRGVRVEY